MCTNHYKCSALMSRENANTLLALVVICARMSDLLWVKRIRNFQSAIIVCHMFSEICL